MNNNHLRVMISEIQDPWFNLATEDWIFNDMDTDTNILYLWRNQDTVVIGRFQNPWEECNIQKMEQDGILLARRQSGGGAVFHDLGNTNFTFLSPQKNFNKEVNFNIIIRAIKRFGVSSYISGRNDLVVDAIEGPRKVSGSAFKEGRDRAFHHGTLLINANLTKLEQYLNPNKKKLLSKGIKSVRSRVCNLTSFNHRIEHDSLCMAIIYEFFNHYQKDCPIEILDYNYLKNIPELNTYCQKLKDWEWRFGNTPSFNHHLAERFDWGSIDVHIDAQKGVMEKISIFSDSLYPNMIESLTNILRGKRYSKEEVGRAIKEVQQKLPDRSSELEEFGSWIMTEIQSH